MTVFEIATSSDLWGFLGGFFCNYVVKNNGVFVL